MTTAALASNDVWLSTAKSQESNLVLWEGFWTIFNGHFYYYDFISKYLYGPSLTGFCNSLLHTHTTANMQLYFA